MRIWYLIMSICLGLGSVFSHAQPATLLHAKVIQSNTPPETTDRPDNFKQFDTITKTDYFYYEYPEKSGKKHYVLVGYQEQDKEDALQASTTLLERDDQV